MKVLGFSCGRKMGNTEVLVKEALMGAEELGVDVEILRMLDLDIRPCRFCTRCLSREEGPGACVIKDDADFFYNTIMDCDGLILGAPVYTLGRPGYLKMIEDRVLGPKTDVAALRERKKKGGIDPRTGRKLFTDERGLKSRVGAFISDGGSSTANWLSFGLPLLYTFTFPLQIEIVDHLRVYSAQDQPGSVLLNEKAVKRARLLGRHVAEEMGKPINEVKWRGDEPGICPVCHCNLLTVTGKNPVECPVCGVSGKLKIDGDKISVAFSKKERARSRLMIAGKLEHLIQILNEEKELPPRVDELPLKMEKYESYLSSLEPPSKSRKA